VIDVLFVNPPFNRTRPDYASEASLARFEMDAINPGILSMATYLRSKGAEVEIADFYRQKDMSVVESELADRLSRDRPMAVGISNLSAYDYLDVLAIAGIVKTATPEVAVLVGGQHASALGSQVLQDGPSIDGLVEGEGELPMLEILSRLKEGRELAGTPSLWTRQGGAIRPPLSCRAPIDLDMIPPLDYAIYPDARSFTPYVEESRGCHLTCDYCNNASFYGGKARATSPCRFRMDLDSATSFFGRERLYAVMTANFVYKGRHEKLKALRAAGIRWSTEMSCDLPWHTMIGALAESGMFLLNVGFESASRETLKRMRKTKNMDRYLGNAARILDETARYRSVRARYNLMIYPGDTYRDLAPTEEFLVRNRGGLAAVVCCPAIAYPGSGLYARVDALENDAQAMRTGFCDATHHYPIHPSHEISFERATEICLDIEERFSPTRILSLKHDYRTYEGQL
jgi:radical SAM superfamily enzyme YgiQ (UPF0313 family)